MPSFKKRVTESIVKALRELGEFRTEVPAEPTQGVVDVWWAAHAAGRELNTRVQVATEAGRTAPGQSLVIIVRSRRAAFAAGRSSG